MLQSLKTAVGAFANGVEKVVTEISSSKMKDTVTTENKAKDKKEEKNMSEKKIEKIIVSVPDGAIVNGGVLTLKVVREDNKLEIREINYEETEPDTKFRATVE